MRSLLRPGPTSVEELERLVTSPLDPDYECWRAARRGRYVRTRTGLVVPSRLIRDERGSFLTGTNVETIYSNQNAGTAKNTFTAEFQINDRTAMGYEPQLPANFFLPGGEGVARAVRITARGLVSTTTAAPTWQHFCRFNSTTPANPPTGPNVGSTPSTAAVAALSMTNLLWEYEADIQMVTQAAAAGSTLRGLGIFTAQTNNSTLASLSVPIFGGNASPGTVATFDTGANTFITYSVACGTSNAANQVQLLQLLVFGLN